MTGFDTLATKADTTALKADITALKRIVGIQGAISLATFAAVLAESARAARDFDVGTRS